MQKAASRILNGRIEKPRKSPNPKTIPTNSGTHHPHPPQRSPQHDVHPVAGGQHVHVWQHLGAIPQSQLKLTGCGVEQ